MILLAIAPTSDMTPWRRISMFPVIPEINAFKILIPAVVIEGSSEAIVTRICDKSMEPVEASCGI